MERPFKRIVEVVMSSRDILPKPILFQGVGLNIIFESNNGISFVDRLSFSEFKNAIKSAEIVISHAGVGVIIECLQLGRKPIVMPRQHVHNEHINDHQIELCNYLMELGDVLYCFNSVEELCFIINEKSLVSDINTIPLFSNDLITVDIRKYIDLL
jgi:UDP-N-acetylglucosamine transferase subunit ALG13